AILLFNARSELAKLRPKLSRLQLEVGELVVEDKAQFHAIQVPTNDLFHWRWRLNLPDGFDCYLHSFTGVVPESGYQSDDWMYNSRYIGSYDDQREFFLDLKVGKNYKDVYSLTATYNNQSVIINTFDDGPPDWLAGRSQYDIEICGDREVVTAAPRNELYLIRLRTTAIGQKNDSQGFLVWLSTKSSQPPKILRPENSD
ncbi:MAG: hypothetical protein AAF623_20730, partial [Planctomycetota bacterium]